MKYSLKGLVLIYVIPILLINIDIFTCKYADKKLKSFVDDDEITTITKDSESELLDALEILYKNGGTIYIDTPVINLSEENSIIMDGDLPGGIIGNKAT